MPHYIALVHKDSDGCYGVSFPDVPGVFTAGDTIDEAMRNAAEVLAFAAEDGSDLSGESFPQPRTIDELRLDPEFKEKAADAIIAAVRRAGLPHPEEPAQRASRRMAAERHGSRRAASPRSSP